MNGLARRRMAGSSPAVAWFQLRNSVRVPAGSVAWALRRTPAPGRRGSRSGSPWRRRGPPAGCPPGRGCRPLHHREGDRGSCVAGAGSVDRHARDRAGGRDVAVAAAPEPAPVKATVGAVVYPLPGVGQSQVGDRPVGPDRRRGRRTRTTAAGDRHSDVGRRQGAVGPVRPRPEVVRDVGQGTAGPAAAAGSAERPIWPAIAIISAMTAMMLMVILAVDVRAMTCPR